MSKNIEVSDPLYERLQSLAGQLFTMDEVIEKLLRSAPCSSAVDSALVTSPSPSPHSSRRADLNVLQRRAPRQRGITIEVSGHRIDANTIPDLYKQVLTLVLDKCDSQKLNSIVPYLTSPERFLIACEPRHPNSKKFFAPIQVGHYYMETHKNYETALKHLDKFLAKLGLDLRPISQ